MKLFAIFALVLSPAFSHAGFEFEQNPNLIAMGDHQCATPEACETLAAEFKSYSTDKVEYTTKVFPGWVSGKATKFLSVQVIKRK